jgi:DNA gyrase subunit A
VNGASGIAVGMATSIPPHNLAEVIDALQYLLKHWEKLDDVTIGDLMNFVQGPDFPTGGLILQNHDQNDVLAAYATGRGKVTVRGRVSLEEMTRGKSRIIINELPYLTNKASLIERIAELVREGTLGGIADLRDESDRQGMRIVIELSKAADAEKILRDLYKKTPLEGTFSINLLALVDGQPRLLTLKQALKVYLEHRIEVVKRRCEFDLRKALERLHILEGLRIAIKNLDEVIATIRAAQDSDQAKERLMKKFKLSENQAQAILDMPLKRLAALERKKIELEYKEILEHVKELETLLKSPIKMRLEVGKELAEIRARYQDRRRTQIVSLEKGKEAHELLTVQDVTPAENTWVGMTVDGRIFRMNTDTPPRTSGREAPISLLRVDTHQVLYLLAKNGKCATLAIHVIPGVEKPEDGVVFQKICSLQENDPPIKIFSLPPNSPLDDNVITTLSREGMIKKSALADLPGPSSQPFLLAKVNDGDEIIDALISEDGSEYLVATSDGMAIRFEGEEVRAMGLVAAGVNAIKLPKQTTAIGLLDLENAEELLFVTSDGFGWRIQKGDFPIQGRYGQGVVIGKMKPGSKIIGITSGKKNQNITVFLKKSAAKAIRLDVIPLGKRGSAPKILMELKSADSIERITRPVDESNRWALKKPKKKPIKENEKSGPKTKYKQQTIL